MTETHLIHTECGTGYLVAVGQDGAQCSRCLDTLSISQDIAPYADGATLVVGSHDHLVAVTA